MLVFWCILLRDVSKVWIRTIMYQEALTENAFTNLWYWAVIVIAWINLIQYTFGIPREIFSAARKGDAQAQKDVLALIDINARFIISDFTKFGSLLVLMTCFVLSSFATIGFKNDIYTLQALFFIGLPIAVIGIMSFVYSKKLVACSYDWEIFCRTYNMFWYIKWAMALISISFTMFWAVYIEVTAF